GRKVAKLMEWVAMVGCPIVGINDSGGARIQDAVTSLAWYAELGRRHELLRGVVPEVSIILGKCAGGAVYSPIQTDLVVAVRERGSVCVRGPGWQTAVPGGVSPPDDPAGAGAPPCCGNTLRLVEPGPAFSRSAGDSLFFFPPNTFAAPPIVNPGLEPEITPQD